MNDYEFDWAKDILGDYSSYSYRKSAEPEQKYERSASYSTKFDNLLDEYNEDLYDKSTFSKIESPSYVSQPTGAATYRPSSTHGLDDYYKDYKPDFSTSYT